CVTGALSIFPRVSTVAIVSGASRTTAPAPPTTLTGRLVALSPGSSARSVLVVLQAARSAVTMQATLERKNLISCEPWRSTFCDYSSIFTANVVPRTPSIVVGVFTFMASGERFAIWPETIAKVPCWMSVRNSPSWVVGLKRNCLSSIRLLGPAERRVLSMKVIPTLPLGPVVSTSACSIRSPVLAGRCTLFRERKTCPATFLICPISAQAEWPSSMTNQAIKAAITAWRHCVMLSSSVENTSVSRVLSIVWNLFSSSRHPCPILRDARVRLWILLFPPPYPLFFGNQLTPTRLLSYL